MSGGWIKVPRELMDCSHFLNPQARGEPACALLAFIDLMRRARWRDGGGLKRGQLKTGQKTLAKLWNWERSRVQRFLRELEDAGEITRTNFGGRIPDTITICHYNTYQGERTANSSPTGSLSAPAYDSPNETSDRSHIEEKDGGQDEDDSVPTSSSNSEVGAEPDQVSKGASEAGAHTCNQELLEIAASRLTDPNGKVTRDTIVGWTRRILGARESGREASVLDQLLQEGHAISTIGRALVGLAIARDSEQLKGFIEPGEPCGLRALRTDHHERSVWDIAVSAFHSHDGSHQTDQDGAQRVRIDPSEYSLQGRGHGRPNGKRRYPWR